MLTLRLDNDVTKFEPGAQVIATAEWQLDRPAKAIELRLLWFTRGKGDSDEDVVREVTFDDPGSSGQKRLGIQLPDSPYSFSGKLVSLMWALELETLPAGETERLEITVAPGGHEIVLGMSDNSADDQTNFDEDEDKDKDEDKLEE